MTEGIYGICGTGGFAREVMCLARKQLIRDNGTIGQLVFIDKYSQKNLVNGHKVITYQEFMDIEAANRQVTIAIANSVLRQKLAEQIIADNVKLWDVKASNVMIMDAVEIGTGAILSPFVTITSNIKIGLCFQANLYSYVAHDCQIGDFVTFAPGVKCNGNVTIKNHAYIGAGAIMRPGKPNKPIVIGEKAIVGMGAVVTKSVPAGVTVMGNPAAPLSRKFIRKNKTTHA